MEEDLTLRQARAMLADWLTIHRSRDDRIRAAADAGLSITEIAVLLECGRATVYRALASQSSASGEPAAR